jgi:hypothetical protein
MVRMERIELSLLRSKGSRLPLSYTLLLSCSARVGASQAFYTLLNEKFWLSSDILAKLEVERYEYTQSNFRQRWKILSSP